MADLYRKSSLEKLSNPDQLDRMIKISSPLSWLALVSVLLIIAATVVWAFLGTIPTTETVNGIITGADSSCAVFADASGVISTYNKQIGDSVTAGEVVARITRDDGTIGTICADVGGRLSGTLAEPGTPVYAGSEIARITPSGMGDQVVVCYVPLTSSLKYKKDMEVRIYPTAVDSQQYGHMQARIVHIEKYASNTAGLMHNMGSDNLLAEQFVSAGPVVAVLCRLNTDYSSANGYYWTHSNGHSLTVTNGTVVSAKIVVEECAPVTKLIGSLG